MAKKICSLIKNLGPCVLNNPDQLAQLLEEKLSVRYHHEVFLITFALRAAIDFNILPKMQKLPKNLNRPIAREDLLALGAHIVNQLGVSADEAENAAAILELVVLEVSAGEGIEARPGNLEMKEAKPSAKIMSLSPRGRIWAWICASALIMLLGFSAYSLLEDRRPEGGEFRIAFLAPLTGSSSRYGQSALRGAMLAAEEINARGGVKGYNVQITGFDVPSQEHTSDIAQKALAAQQPNLMISMTGDIGGASIAAWSTNNKIPVIAINGGSKYITTADGVRPHPYIFRMVYDYDFEGRLLAYMARHGLGAKTAAIFYYLKSPRSEAISRSFDDAYQKLGGAVTIRYGIESDKQNLDDILKSLMFNGVEVLIIPDRGELLLKVIAAARGAGYDGPIVATGWDDALYSKAKSGKNFERTWWISHISCDDPMIKPFLAAYSQKYKNNLPKNLVQPSLIAYDSIKLAAHALHEASNYRHLTIKNAIASVRNLPLTHATLTMDEKTHSPSYKAAALSYYTNGEIIFQKRIWIKRK